MSYDYTDGQGLSALDKTTPNGATEPVSNLDDAIRQVKAYLKDGVAGVAKIQTDVTAGNASLTSLGTRMTAAETDIATGAADITTLQTDQATLKTTVDSLVIVAGGSPVTAIIIADTPQDCLSVDVAAVIEFDQVAVDTNAAFDIVNHQYVIPKAGLYDVLVSILVHTTATTGPTVILHELALQINGVIAATTLESAGADTEDRTILLSRKFQLAATNVIRATYKVGCPSGGSMTSRIQTVATSTIFQANRLSA